MKITILYDNESQIEHLRPDWGFSCLVEIEDAPKILFDTGANGSILLQNMKKLNIDPKSIDKIFISHDHWDHVGGLSDFLKVNKNTNVYVPGSSKFPKINVISVTKPTKIQDNVFSTGELQGIEQSLTVKTKKGTAVIVGCSHPGVRSILNAASQFGRIYALIGGMHGFREFDLIKDLEMICPCHCTQHKSEIKKLYPDKSVDGGVGKVIEV
jgi:7,8-dihydropterin-6-yl-methyl-4-(beta-D-ribofuranosyl)aminobenzene 5'-phosphate synthase